MFSATIIHQALARADVTPEVASAPSPMLAGSIVASVPRSSGGQITKSRNPHNGNNYASSPFRPQVLASDRLRCWVSPHALSHYNKVISQIPFSSASILMDVMLSSLEPKTRSNYGAGLLRFTQFCDQLDIPEKERCPASEVFLSAFIAS
jgi:hypothetical protein